MEEKKLFDCEALPFEQTGPSSPGANRSSGGHERAPLLLVSLLAAVAVIALVLSVALAFGDAHNARTRTNELERRLSELQNAFQIHKVALKNTHNFCIVFYSHLRLDLYATPTNAVTFGLIHSSGTIIKRKFHFLLLICFGTSENDSIS